MKVRNQYQKFKNASDHVKMKGQILDKLNYALSLPDLVQKPYLK